MPPVELGVERLKACERPARRAQRVGERERLEHDQLAAGREHRMDAFERAHRVAQVDEQRADEDEVEWPAEGIALELVHRALDSLGHRL